jgi:hypothetical protein
MFLIFAGLHIDCPTRYLQWNALILSYKVPIMKLSDLRYFLKKIGKLFLFKR